MPDKLTILKAVARTGFVAKGFVYFLVGLLSLQAAIGLGGDAPSATQALEQIIYRPFGSILLIGIIIGLLAYSAWRILQAIFDPEDRGKETNVWFFRLIDFLTGCLYLSMSYAAWQILQGLHATSSDENTEVWVGRVLELPYGKWLVMVCAAVILIAGFYQFYSAWIASFDYSFDADRMSEFEKNMLRWLGRIGFFAWGIVYSMVSVMFYQAAITFNAEQAGGLAEALHALREQPFGIWILTITATGLIIYGVYLLVLSYYHKVYESNFSKESS
jgi:hypothetical protein